jgi:hypothetical protein
MIKHNRNRLIAGHCVIVLDGLFDLLMGRWYCLFAELWLRSKKRTEGETLYRNRTGTSSSSSQRRHGSDQSSLELHRNSDFGHHFQIQGHGDGEEWMGMLIPGSPWAEAARRGRSTRATFLCARTEEVGGSSWEMRGGVGESPVLL